MSYELEQAREQLQEGQGNLAEAKQNVSEQKKRIGEYEEQVSGITVPRRSLKFQQEYVRTGKVSMGRSQQYVKTRANYKRVAEEQIGKAKGELETYEKGDLAAYEQEINRFGGQVKEQEAYESAVEYWKDGQSYFWFKGEPEYKYLKRLWTEYGSYKRMQQERAEAIKFNKELKRLEITPVVENNKIVGFYDEKLKMSYDAKELPTVLQKYRTEDIPQFTKLGLVEKVPENKMSMNPFAGTTFAENMANASLLPEYREKGYTGQFEEKKEYSSNIFGQIEKSTMELREKENKNIWDYGKQVPLGFAFGAVETTRGLKQLGTGLATEPISTIKGIPKGVWESGKNLYYLTTKQPAEAIGRIGFEVVALKGTGKALKSSGKVAELGSARLSTKFTPLKAGKIIVEGEKPIVIKVVNRIPTESVESQFNLAGKTTTAVTAQRDLFKITKNKIEIEKPIAVSEGYPGLSKSSLKQLEELKQGKEFSAKQIKQLDINIRKETGSKGLLEKSFFADPKGRLRPSRLGIVEKPREATLLDIFRGKVSIKDIKFRQEKPQAIVFEKAKVESIPRNVRTPSQLLKFQQKRSGKFKPVGFMTRESEITLAPGEIIKKVRTSGVTIIKGRKVKIISAKVVRGDSLSKGTQKLIKSSKKGELGAIKKYILKKRLERETGISYSEGYGKAYVSPSVEMGKLSKLSTTNISYKKGSNAYKRSLMSKSPISKYSTIKRYRTSSPLKPSYPYKSTPRSPPSKTPSIKPPSYPPRSPPRYPPRIPPYKSPPRPPFRPPRIPPATPNPPIKIKIRMSDIVKKKRYKSRRQTKYIPSFAASALNMTAFKKPKGTGKDSYLPGFRPIIIRKPKKRKYK